MSKVSQICLSTIYNTNKSNPTFYLNEPIFGIASVKISEVCIPNSFYTFDSRNDKISFLEDSGDTTTITIPSSNYTSSSLCTALKTLFEANSQYTKTYTITYSSATAKLTIAVNSGTITFLPIEKNAYYEMGLTNSLNNASASITTDVVDLSGVKLINLVSNSFGYNIANLVGTNYSILASIPINSSFLSILYYSNPNELIDVNTDNLYSISFKLYDERLRELSTTNDYQITVILKTV